MRSFNADQSPLQYWALRSPDCLALSTEKRQYTWQQLAQSVRGYVQALHQQGVERGDVITCVGKNSPELVLIYLACIEAGVICAITMPQPESSLKTKLATLYCNNAQIKVWSNVSEQTIDIAASSALQLPLNIALATHDDAEQYAGSALASIIFTSGSTGVPKAVAHSHQQHLASAQGLLERFKFHTEDTWLLSLPMYHVSGLAIIYRWLLAGARLKVGSGDLLTDIRAVTHASLVATQLTRLLDSDVELELTHVLLGGSHVPLALSQQAAKQGIETWLGYGMTEAASTVTAKKIDAHYSAGQVLARRKVELRGERIYIGGETLASGYYQRGTLTPIVDSQGWFDSNDLGQWSEYQELVIKGRADNLFISGGENIHCEEIEQALNGHPAVQLAIVIPVADQEFGARPIAVVKTTQPIEQIDFSTWLSARLVKFKHPIDYFPVPQSVQTGAIKVSSSAVKRWVSTHTKFTVI